MPADTQPDSPSRSRLPLPLRLLLGLLGFACAAYAALYAWQSFWARREERPKADLPEIARGLFEPLGALRGRWVTDDVVVAAAIVALGCVLLYLGRWRGPAVALALAGGLAAVAKPFVQPLRGSYTGGFHVHGVGDGVHAPFVASGSALLAFAGLLALGLRLPGGRSVASLFFGRGRKVPYALLPLTLAGMLVAASFGATEFDELRRVQAQRLVCVALAVAGVLAAAFRASKANPAAVAGAFAAALLAKPALAPVVWTQWRSAPDVDGYFAESHLEHFLLPALPLVVLSAVLAALAVRARRKGLVAAAGPADQVPASLGGRRALALQLAALLGPFAFVATASLLANRPARPQEALVGRVKAAHWERKVEISRLQAVQKEGWALDKPEGAFDVREVEQRVHHVDTVCDQHGREEYFESVPDGEKVEYYKERVHCGYRSVYKKCDEPGCTGGSFQMEDQYCDERRERRTPKTKSVSRSRTVCTKSHEEPRKQPWSAWKVMEWRYDRSWQAQGDDGAPRDPTPADLAPPTPLAPKEEERQRPSAAYRVVFVDQDELEHTLVVERPEALAAYPVGSFHRLEYKDGTLGATPLAVEAR